MAQRYMFVNSSDALVKVEVYTPDRIRLCQLVEAAPVETPEAPAGEYGPGPFALEVPPGVILGFLTEHTAAITDPQAANFVMHVANGNVPWPEPPPQEQIVRQDIADFKARYRCFLDLAA